MKNILIILLVMLMVILISCQKENNVDLDVSLDTGVSVGITQDVTKLMGDKIKKENENYSIEWMDTQGYGADGDFHLSGKLQCKAQDCSGVDMGIISPSPFQAGSKAWYYKEVNTTTVTPHSYFCNSGKYGWQVVGKSVWCNTTVVDNTTYDIKDIRQVGSPYNFVTKPKNATIYWNTTKTEVSIAKTELTSKWNYKSLITPYGDHVYYLKNIDLSKGREYDFDIVLRVDKKLLPIKYSVVLGDFTTNKIYYFLDPTIVNSRTWSNNDDFTNGTVRTNLTTSATGITLTPAGVEAGTLLYNFTFDNIAIANFSLHHEYNTCTFVITTDQCITGSCFRQSAVECSAWAFLPNWVLDFENNSYQIKGWTKNVATQSADMFTGVFQDINNFLREGTTDNAGWTRNISHINNAGSYTGSAGNAYSGATQTYKWCVTNISAGGYHTFGCYNDSGEQGLTYFTNIGATNMTFKWGNFSLHGGRDGRLDDVELWKPGAPIPAKTHGEYSDRQGWSPQTGNQITNITITSTNSSGGNIRFRHNSTNASVDTSDWTILSNGTQTLTLNLGSGNSIFYQFDFNGTGTGKVSSYTISELTTMTLNGTVYDKNNQTVANASVFVINEVGNSTTATLTSNATGLFWTSISTPSNYTLYAWKNSNVSAGAAIKTHVEVN